MGSCSDKKGRKVPLTFPSLPLLDRTWLDSQPDQYQELKNPEPVLLSETKNKTHKNDNYYEKTWKKKCHLKPTASQTEVQVK